MEHRIGFVGAGDVVRKAYLPALASRVGCHIKAISSRSMLSAGKLAAQYGIERVFGGYEELVGQDDIDTVFICTPPYLHSQIAEATMQGSKNVLIEKPLCTNYQAGRSLLQRARTYARTFYVASNNYFREENQWLKSQVIDGEVGNIEVIDFEWYRRRRYEDKSWLYNPALSGGGVLMDLGYHMIHLALSLIPQRVRFAALCKNLRHEWQSGVESTATSMITVDDKITILLKLGWDMNLPTRSRVVLRVYGDKACLSNQDYQGNKTEGFSRMVDDFFRHIEARVVPDLGLIEDTMLLLDALYEADRSQSIIRGEFCVAR